MSNTAKFYGNALGIVVQNNDPEKRGRVKVFVPHINIALYDDWNKTFQKPETADKHFVFPDQNTNPDLDKVLDYLKAALPWAEIALPPFGGSASARYNAFTKKGTTSDSNYWENGTYQEGFRPLVTFTGQNRVSDAFTQTEATHNRLVNQNANQYTPSDYSNLARGFFTIPNVGAHVWIFFVDGDVNYPVVFAVSYGQEDWKRIYSKSKAAEDIAKFISPDYPESFENLSGTDTTSGQGLDHNQKTFRAKHVLNSNKHSLEFVDTDLAEVLKMTHYSGSFFEMNNNANTTLATANDQKLVLGDQFLTVRKNQAIYVANYQEVIVDGDRFTKLGNFDARQALVTQILINLRELHQYKMLFEVMRAEAKYPYTSMHQKRTGEFAACPVCGGEGMKFGLPCITCTGFGELGKSPSSQWGIWEPEDEYKWKDTDVDVEMWTGKGPNFRTQNFATKEILKKIRETQQKNLQYEAEFGNGGDDLETVTGSRVTTIGTVFNDLASFRVDPVGKIRNQGTNIAIEGTYLSMAECPLVEYVDVDSLPGGDWDVTVGNKYSLHVGSKGIRIKTTGPLDLYGTIVNIYGESLNIASDWELLLEGKKRVDVRGDIISLHPTEGKRGYVLLDGNVGVRNNLTVIGGAHVEGEFSCQHITAPQEMYVTNIGYGPVAHTHNFFGPSWLLKPTCDEVRMAAQPLNQPEPAPNMKCPGGFWVPD